MINYIPSENSEVLLRLQLEGAEEIGMELGMKIGMKIGMEKKLSEVIRYLAAYMMMTNVEIANAIREPIELVDRVLNEQVS